MLIVFLSSGLEFKMLFDKIITLIASNKMLRLVKVLFRIGFFRLPVFSILPIRKIIRKAEFSIFSKLDDDVFDADYYLARNPDVANSEIPPLEHFIKYGSIEGRKPSAIFDVVFYRTQAGLGDNYALSELSHFRMHGCKSNITPSPWFDFQYYRRVNRDISASKINLFRHYLHFGIKENRIASPKFDPKVYYTAHPEALEQGIPAITHFIDQAECGAKTLNINNKPMRRSYGKNSEDLIENIENALDELPVHMAIGEPEIDVIVPVYGDLEITLRCLYSVLKSENKTTFNLVVIDDKSPEPRLSKKLQVLARRGLFELIYHKKNLGFVKSVNQGMKLNTDRDVILLNSDTEVFNDWVDRLKQAAYAKEKISSVTPITNNGTICSYPDFDCDNPNPLEVSYLHLDKIAAMVNAGKTVDVPTGVGYCMYIRRDALSDIGYFDEEAFGRGYGEENDFCLRGQNKGWTDIVTTNIFVRHHGATSFQDESNERIQNAIKIIGKRFPDYQKKVEEFIAQDPLCKARASIDLERLKLLSREKNVLILSHQLGGGTEQHVLEQAAQLEKAGHGLFRLFAAKNNKNVVHLTGMDIHDVPNLGGFHIEDDQDKLIEILSILKIDLVHIHHLIDLSDLAPIQVHDFLKSAGLEYHVTIHDYLPICPRVNLVDKSGIYCGEPAHEACDKCLVENLKRFETKSIVLWRMRYDLLLKDAAHVIVPHKDVQLRCEKYFPKVKFEAVPHDEILPAPLKMRNRKGHEPVRIGIVGAISSIKGFDVITLIGEYIQLHKLPVKLVVVGYTQNDIMARRTGIEVTGPYSNEEILEVIDQQKLDLIFYPGVWPETFCYTLSKVFQTGLPIATFDIGAIASRLGGAQHKLCIPLSFHDKPKETLSQLTDFEKICRTRFEYPMNIVQERD